MCRLVPSHQRVEPRFCWGMRRRGLLVVLGRRGVRWPGRCGRRKPDAVHGRAPWRRAAGLKSSKVARPLVRRGGSDHRGGGELDDAIALRAHGGARLVPLRRVKAAALSRIQTAALHLAQLGVHARALVLRLGERLAQQRAVDCGAQGHRAPRRVRRAQLTMHLATLLRQLRLGSCGRLRLEGPRGRRVGCRLACGLLGLMRALNLPERAAQRGRRRLQCGGLRHRAREAQAAFSVN